MFRFKQFSIEDNLSSMKVGTDAVLLGSWATLPAEGVILDVGCGCGVIGLMAAQRAPQSQILGLDIHRPSVEQARYNSERSPFCNASFECQDFRAFNAPVHCILSNPPYHTESLQSPCASRAAARSEAHLPFVSLIRHSAELLVKGGHLQVVIPTQAERLFHSLCNEAHLTLCRQTLVRTSSSKVPKRVLLDFKKGPNASVERTEIVLTETGGVRSKTYNELCKDFYL